MLKMLKLFVLLNINIDDRASEHTLSLRSSIFGKTDSQYYNKFCEVNEYSEFYKHLVSSARFLEFIY